MQVLYTTVLKHTAILDVMSISGGFVIRALAGVAAVSSPISPWLIVCTGLLTLFLGFSKRRHEIATLGEGAAVHRRNLQDYSVPLLDEMMNIMISATIIAYTLYTFTVYERQDQIFMMASIPFVVYGVFRYMLLVHRDGGGNPDTLLLSDRPLQIALFLWLVVVMRGHLRGALLERLRRNLVLALALGVAVYVILAIFSDLRQPRRRPRKLRLRPDTGDPRPRRPLLRGTLFPLDVLFEGPEGLRPDRYQRRDLHVRALDGDLTRQAG